MKETYFLMHTLTSVSVKIAHQQTILAIENNEDSLIYISSALDLFEYNCLTAQDAALGLYLAKKWRPDLIVLDIKMPRTSGIELIKMLKTDWLTKAIPVIAVTALASKEDKKLILESGFSDYLLKPYLLEELADMIHSHID